MTLRPDHCLLAIALACHWALEVAPAAVRPELVEGRTATLRSDGIESAGLEQELRAALGGGLSVERQAGLEEPAIPRRYRATVGGAQGYWVDLTWLPDPEKALTLRRRVRHGDPSAEPSARGLGDGYVDARRGDTIQVTLTDEDGQRAAYQLNWRDAPLSVFVPLADPLLKRVRVPAPIRPAMAATPDVEQAAFRRWLQAAALGPGTSEARRSLIEQFGAQAVAGEGGITRRPPHGEWWYLFDLPRGADQSRQIRWLWIPRRYRDQTLRLIPAVRQEDLLLSLFQVEPRHLIRQLRWDPVQQRFVRLGRRQREILRSRMLAIPGVVTPREDSPYAKLALLRLDPRTHMTLEEVVKATSLSKASAHELARQGYLYRDQGGRIPTPLAIFIQETVVAMNRTEYPLGFLGELTGEDPRAVAQRIRASDLPIAKRVGQAQRLSHDVALAFVLKQRLKSWVASQVGGLVSWVMAAKELGVSEPELIQWGGDPPWFGGAPLWVAFEGRRFMTRRGLEALKVAEANALRRVRKDEAMLLDAARNHYPHAHRVGLARKYYAVFRAAQELGVPWRFLDHPLVPAQPIVIVPRGRLREIFREARRPTPWTRESLHPEGRYRLGVAATLLECSLGHVIVLAERQQLAVERAFGRPWVSGAEILRYYAEQVLPEQSGERPRQIPARWKYRTPEAAEQGFAERTARKLPNNSKALLRGEHADPGLYQAARRFGIALPKGHSGRAPGTPPTVLRYGSSASPQDTEALRALLRPLIERAASVRGLALRLNVSPSHLSNLMNGKMGMTEPMRQHLLERIAALERTGLEEVITAGRARRERLDVGA